MTFDARAARLRAAIQEVPVSTREPALTRRAVLASVLAAGAALAGGCGFEMRGGAVLPKDIHSLYFRGPGDLASQIAIQLDSSGVAMAPAATGADAIVTVISYHWDRTVLSVDPHTGKDREYELTYTLSFEVTGRNHATLVRPQTIRIQRDYVFDPNAVLGSSNEESVIRGEMTRDAAQQLMRRMEATLHR